MTESSWLEAINQGAEYIDELFTLPKTEALVPLNPHRYGPYIIGALLGSRYPNVEDKFSQPTDNFGAMQEFLTTSPTDAIYNDRFRTVIKDLFSVNGMCEIDGYAGSVAVGMFASNKADEYTASTAIAVDAELNLSQGQKIIRCIYRGKAIEEGRKVPMVWGTGTFK